MALLSGNILCKILPQFCEDLFGIKNKKSEFKTRPLLTSISIKNRLLPVAPQVILATDVAHLHLEAVRVIRREGHYTAFKSLHQHLHIFAAYFDGSPVGFGDWEAHRENPINHIGICDSGVLPNWVRSAGRNPRRARRCYARFRSHKRYNARYTE